jgi:hypothetical protein
MPNGAFQKQNAVMFGLALAQADVQNDGDRLRIMRNQDKLCLPVADITPLVSLQNGNFNKFSASRPQTKIMKQLNLFG